MKKEEGRQYDNTSYIDNILESTEDIVAFMIEYNVLIT